MYIVAYLWDPAVPSDDDNWDVYDTLEAAQKRYRELIEADYYSVTIAAVVQSTDYDPA